MVCCVSQKGDLPSSSPHQAPSQASTRERGSVGLREAEGFGAPDDVARPSYGFAWVSCVCYSLFQNFARISPQLHHNSRESHQKFTRISPEYRIGAPLITTTTRRLPTPDDASPLLELRQGATPSSARPPAAGGQSCGRRAIRNNSRS